MIAILVLGCAGASLLWWIVSRSRRAARPIPSSVEAGPGLSRMIQDLCKESPQMISLHLPQSLPESSIEPEGVKAAVAALLEFFARRKAKGILVAAGCGALSVEIVLADAGPDITDADRERFLDWSVPTLPARMELDARLRNACEFLASKGGSLSLEARLEGGVSIRMRLPRQGGAR
jgi:hypothetical protein